MKAQARSGNSQKGAFKVKAKCVILCPRQHASYRRPVLIGGELPGGESRAGCLPPAATGRPPLPAQVRTQQHSNDLCPLWSWEGRGASPWGRATPVPLCTPAESTKGFQGLPAARCLPDSSSSSQTGGDWCLGRAAGPCDLGEGPLVLAGWEGSALWPLRRRSSWRAASSATPESTGRAGVSSHGPLPSSCPRASGFRGRGGRKGLTTASARWGPDLRLRARPFTHTSDSRMHARPSQEGVCPTAIPARGTGPPGQFIPSEPTRRWQPPASFPGTSFPGTSCPGNLLPGRPYLWSLCTHDTEEAAATRFLPAQSRGPVRWPSVAPETQPRWNSPPCSQRCVSTGLLNNKK